VPGAIVRAFAGSTFERISCTLSGDNRRLPSSSPPFNSIWQKRM
jgi:hypothetical protein